MDPFNAVAFLEQESKFHVATSFRGLNKVEEQQKLFTEAERYPPYKPPPRPLTPLSSGSSDLEDEKRLAALRSQKKSYKHSARFKLGEDDEDMYDEDAQVLPTAYMRGPDVVILPADGSEEIAQSRYMMKQRGEVEDIDWSQWAEYFVEHDEEGNERPPKFLYLDEHGDLIDPNSNFGRLVKLATIFIKSGEHCDAFTYLDQEDPDFYYELEEFE